MHSTTDIQYKLDLHGERREKAIQKLISFLDQIRHNHKKKNPSQQYKNKNKQIMVTVVTGSGSHSMEGPILRTAVEKVLKKRRMTYHLTHKRGAFIVDALSGIELSYDEQGSDSKVVLLNNDEDFTLLHHITKSSKSNAVPGKKLSSLQRSCTSSTATSSSGNLADIIGDDNPSPSEVAAFDDSVKKAKELSLKDVAMKQSIKGKATNELNKAIELSKQAKKNQEEKELKEIERLTADAIELSKQSAKEEEERIDQELQEVMEMSKNDAYSSSNEQLEQEALEYALRMSQRDAMVYDAERNQIGMDDDEKLIQMALELSKVECHKAVR